MECLSKTIMAHWTGARKSMRTPWTTMTSENAIVELQQKSSATSNAQLPAATSLTALKAPWTSTWSLSMSSSIDCRFSVATCKVVLVAFLPAQSKTNKGQEVITLSTKKTKRIKVSLMMTQTVRVITMTKIKKMIWTKMMMTRRARKGLTMTPTTIKLTDRFPRFEWTTHLR